ncbi:MAG: hypothetical protein LBC87_09220 [Fibromonadaceae bacterium]|jgi:hypothetical protein|nr:hypothetical protein [Fibromonadaceae bacterium]
MKKFNIIFCTLAVVLISSCATTQVGVKENWIDERDVISLASSSVTEWMAKAGRPTLVEINGDTSIYYYNYRPTMYATSIYDSTKVIKTWGTVKEVKPSAENSTEIWGSRKNTMQIKVVKDIAISAVITAGPDKKTLVRDLNGDLIIDPASGYNSNISEEMKIDRSSDQFKKAYTNIHGQEPIAVQKPAVEGTNMSPWEYYRHKLQLAAQSVIPAAAQPAAQPAAEPAAAQPVAAQPTEVQPAPEPDTPVATEPPPPPPDWH